MLFNFLLHTCTCVIEKGGKEKIEFFFSGLLLMEAGQSRVEVEEHIEQIMVNLVPCDSLSSSPSSSLS